MHLLFTSANAAGPWVGGVLDIRSNRTPQLWRMELYIETATAEISYTLLSMGIACISLPILSQQAKNLRNAPYTHRDDEFVTPHETILWCH